MGIIKYNILFSFGECIALKSRVSQNSSRLPPIVSLFEAGALVLLAYPLFDLLHAPRHHVLLEKDIVLLILFRNQGFMEGCAALLLIVLGVTRADDVLLTGRDLVHRVKMVEVFHFDWIALEVLCARQMLDVCGLG